MAEHQNRVKELREEKNFSQVRLSMELEVSQETVSAYENGKHYPSAKSLMRMSELFDVSTDYILGLSSFRKSIPQDGLPNDEVLLLSNYRKLDPVRKEKAHSYLKGMADYNP